MPRIIVFDVNETLLDVGVLTPHFVRIFDDAGTLREWFSTASALLAGCDADRFLSGVFDDCRRGARHGGQGPRRCPLIRRS
jgi:hypothetical protein